MTFTYDIYGRKAPIQTGEYKSKLEAIAASWLTSLKIPFIYETKTFQTEIGKYTPDFHLPQIKTFIEVKPTKEALSQSYLTLLNCFCLEQKSDLLILMPAEIIYLEYHSSRWGDAGEINEPEIWNDNEGWIGHCSKCDNIFFTSNVGWYNCRHCNTHEGDHDLTGDTIELNWKKYYQNTQKTQYGRVIE